MQRRNPLDSVAVMKDISKDKEMRMMVRKNYTSWEDVVNDVPQGSVLSPILFLAYMNFINDIRAESYVNVFADAKMQRTMKRKLI